MDLVYSHITLITQCGPIRSEGQCQLCVLTPEKTHNPAPGDLLPGPCTHLRNPTPDPTLAISTKLGLTGQVDHLAWATQSLPRISNLDL